MVFLFVRTAAPVQNASFPSPDGEFRFRHLQLMAGFQRSHHIKKSPSIPPCLHNGSSACAGYVVWNQNTGQRSTDAYLPKCFVVFPHSPPKA